MSDRPNKSEIDREPAKQSSAAERRPWRTPHVIVSHVALTNTDGNAGTDGGIYGSPS